MVTDTKQRLHDGSYRVTQLGRHDGEIFTLSKPIEYDAKCVRLAISKKSDNWNDTADKWLIVINGVAFDYYTGIGHRNDGKPKKPELSSVLYCLVMDANACEESFEDWCSNLGYDTDSRKALQNYLDCQEIGHKLRKAKIYITTELREFLQDY